MLRLVHCSIRHGDHPHKRSRARPKWKESSAASVSLIFSLGSSVKSKHRSPAIVGPASLLDPARRAKKSKGTALVHQNQRRWCNTNSHISALTWRSRGGVVPLCLLVRERERETNAHTADSLGLWTRNTFAGGQVHVDRGPLRPRSVNCSVASSRWRQVPRSVSAWHRCASDNKASCGQRSDR